MTLKDISNCLQWYYRDFDTVPFYIVDEAVKNSVNDLKIDLACADSNTVNAIYNHIVDYYI